MCRVLSAHSIWFAMDRERKAVSFVRFNLKSERTSMKFNELPNEFPSNCMSSIVFDSSFIRHEYTDRQHLRKAPNKMPHQSDAMGFCLEILIQLYILWIPLTFPFHIFIHLLPSFVLNAFVWVQLIFSCFYALSLLGVQIKMAKVSLCVYLTA